MYDQHQLEPLERKDEMVRQSSGVSEKVLSLLQGFDPATDIVFFDWDQTIGGENPVGGNVRVIRSPTTLELFRKLRADYPGRVFIYSNGNNFIFDTAPNGCQILDQTAPYTPDWFSSKKIHVNAKKDPYYSDDNVAISNFNSTTHLVYFPTYHAFYTPRGAKERIQRTIPPGHLKGYHLGTVINILGFSTTKPLRRIYFVDNEASFIEGMRLAVERLMAQGIVQEPLQSAHVPFYDDKR